MPETANVESPNVMVLDLADNPDLKEIFGSKDVGDECVLTFKMKLVSRYPEGVTLSVEKVYTKEDYGNGGTEKKEAEATADHPIMARMRRKDAKNRGMMGPHGRPPETAENSAEPWMTSYV